MPRPAAPGRKTCPRGTPRWRSDRADTYRRGHQILDEFGAAVPQAEAEGVTTGAAAP